MSGQLFSEALLQWLLEGDVAIQYQVQHDLLDDEQPGLRERIASEGWGARFLHARQPTGHWGRGFYLPKWISTHYTLLDLRNLCIPPDNLLICESIAQILEKHSSADGRWLLQAKHAGQVHFDMEQPGQPSRWNTLRALRVLKHFDNP